jgi:hypothetical protein
MPIKLEEKRRFTRVKLANALRLQIRGRTGCDNAVSENISEGGLAFVNDRFIPRSTPLMLEFNLLSRYLSPIARVSWASPVPHSDKYHLGVEFMEVEPGEKSFLSDYVNMQLNQL